MRKLFRYVILLFALTVCASCRPGGCGCPMAADNYLGSVTLQPENRHDSAGVEGHHKDSAREHYQRLGCI